MPDTIADILVLYLSYDTAMDEIFSILVPDMEDREIIDFKHFLRSEDSVLHDVRVRLEKIEDKISRYMQADSGDLIINSDNSIDDIQISRFRLAKLLKETDEIELAYQILPKFKEYNDFFKSNNDFFFNGSRYFQAHNDYIACWGCPEYPQSELSLRFVKSHTIEQAVFIAIDRCLPRMPKQFKSFDNLTEARDSAYIKIIDYFLSVNNTAESGEEFGICSVDDEVADISLIRSIKSEAIDIESAIKKDLQSEEGMSCLVVAYRGDKEDKIELTKESLGEWFDNHGFPEMAEKFKGKLVKPKPVPKKKQVGFTDCVNSSLLQLANDAHKHFYIDNIDPLTNNSVIEIWLEEEALKRSLYVGGSKNKVGISKIMKESIAKIIKPNQ